MNTKQFIAILVVLSVIGIVYVYDTASAIASRSKCADYAMNLTVQSFPNSFEDTGEVFPPKRLKADSAQDVQANYDLFYSYCLNKRGVAGQ